MIREVSTIQRRARLVARHHLASPAASVTAAVEAMIALHATDPLSVYLSAWARTGCARADLEAALYEARGIVRMLGMRRTMFVLPGPLVPVVQRACTDDVARRLRRQLERDLERLGGITDSAAWLRDVETSVVTALTARGSASGAELSADEPRLRTRLVYAPDKSYGGPANITSRVLMLMSAEGLIVRGHPRGGWSSGQFTYHPADAWRGGDADGDAYDPATARTELARRWLLAFGPAPVSDLRWWAGWTAAQTKATLASLPVIEADLDGQPGVMLADDDVPDEEPTPVAALLPALDPTPMGWQERSWFLGPHRASLFDRTGNIGPTLAPIQGLLAGGDRFEGVERGADEFGEGGVRVVGVVAGPLGPGGPEDRDSRFAGQDRGGIANAAFAQCAGDRLCDPRELDEFTLLKAVIRGDDRPAPPGDAAVPEVSGDRLEGGADRFDGRGVPWGVRDRGEDRLPQRVGWGEENLGLVGEVPVERPLRKAGPLGDLRDRGLFESALGEQFERRLLESAAGIRLPSSHTVSIGDDSHCPLLMARSSITC